MNSIYDKTSNEAIISRINKLTKNTQAEWGKMTVDQMFMHCTAAIEIAYGEKEIKVNLMMKILGKLVKNKIFNSEFQHNSPTAQEFIFTDKYEFESAKNVLIQKFNRFSNEGKSAITVMNHPFWGKMSYEDWDKLMWKHMDHHLRQFGV
jgi:small-conductance mechanosensitive channel